MFRIFRLFLLPLDGGGLGGGEGKKLDHLTLPSRAGVVCIFIAAEYLI